MLAEAGALLGQRVGAFRITQVVDAHLRSLVFHGQRVDDPQARVAIKVLVPPPTASPEAQVAFSARSARQIRMASRLRHEHIVPILGCGEVQGCPYLVTPLLEGGSLAAVMAARREPLSLAEVARYAGQLASALDYAHAHGVMHGAVRLQNVLLDQHGRALLADFGLARLLDHNASAGEAPCAPGESTTIKVVRTSPSAAREAARTLAPGEPEGPAADIYALGMLLYELVIGRPPCFEATSPSAGSGPTHAPPIAPHLLRLTVPLPASAAILRALAPRPADCFSSGGALARAFAAGLEGRWTEGLSPQAPQPDREVTLIDPRRETQPGQSPLALPPAQDATACALRWPGAPTPQPSTPTPRRSRSMRELMLLALGCLALFALGWGGAALISTLQASTHGRAALSAPVRGASGVQRSPSMSIGVSDHTVYAVRTSGNSLLWSFATDGRALAAPPVVSGVVYVATDTGHVYALRADTGTPLWSTQVAGGRVAGAPVVANAVVYVATDDGHIYALRSGDSAVVWNTGVPGDHVVGAPVVATNMVYVATQDGHVAALQAGDGAVIWTTQVHADGNVAGSPTVADGMVAIQTQNGNTYTLRAGDGALLAPALAGANR